MRIVCLIIGYTLALIVAIEGQEAQRDVKLESKLDEREEAIPNALDERNKSLKRKTSSFKKLKEMNREKKNSNNEKKTQKNRSLDMKKKLKSKKEKSNKKYSPRQKSSCLDITCLNNLLTVQRVSKDNVVNFIAQKKRLEARLKLAENKKKKSNFIESAKQYLMDSIGGENAMQMNRPMCGGHYNTTDGMMGMNLYHNMSLCNDNIQAMCDLSLTDQEATEMSNCFSVMESFREGVQNCSPTSCSCWAELALTVTGVQDCKDVAYDKEKEVKDLTRDCLDTNGKCKKYEDKSAEYIYMCKTSLRLLTKMLSSLRTSKTLLQNVNTKLSTLLKRTEQAKGSERQSSSIVTTTSTLVTLIKSSTSVDDLVTNSVFITTATSIIQEDTTITVTSVEVTQIQTYINTITGVIQTISTRISMVSMIITDLGGDPVPSPVPVAPSPTTSNPTESSPSLTHIHSSMSANPATGKIPSPTHIPTTSQTLKPNGKQVVLMKPNGKQAVLMKLNGKEIKPNRMC